MFGVFAWPHKIYKISEALQNSVLQNFRNKYFKVAFSCDPQVKHGQLAPFVVIITNYDMCLAEWRQPYPVEMQSAYN